VGSKKEERDGEDSGGRGSNRFTNKEITLRSSGLPKSNPPSPRPYSSQLKMGLSKDNQVSPFTKFRQLEKEQSVPYKGCYSAPNSPKTVRQTNLSRNTSLPPSTRPATNVGPSPKEIILGWVQESLKNYPIPMTNFSSCWSDGLAFCALIHAFYPDSFEWESLSADNREFNFTLAFETAEKQAGILPLLDVEDMVKFIKPDWKCVFTYVQSFYRRFRKMSPVTTKVHTDEHQNHSPAAEGESKEQIESDVQDKKNLSQKHSFSKPLELSFETCNTRQ